MNFIENALLSLQHSFHICRVSNKNESILPFVNSKNKLIREWNVVLIFSNIKQQIPNFFKKPKKVHKSNQSKLVMHDINLVFHKITKTGFEKGGKFFKDFAC